VKGIASASIREKRHRPDLLAAMAGRLATAPARGGEEELVCIGGQTWEARRAEHEKNKKKGVEESNCGHRGGSESRTEDEMSDDG
jgi:hypothetical protein